MGRIYFFTVATGRSVAENCFRYAQQHVLGFIETRHALGEGWRNWVSGRFSAGAASFGYRGLISVGHRFGEKSDGTGLEMLLFSSFADENNMNNYFGVTDADAAASGLAQTDLEGGYRSSGINVIYRNNITASIQIAAQAGVEIYSHAIRQSSIVSDTPDTHAALSALWRF
ncbi:MAG: MipA/OmpV family protein [Pseudomonadales bacterium]|nr:MipA/OmpV family protein [Pseudomonadales bacterium]